MEVKEEDDTIDVKNTIKTEDTEEEKFTHAKTSPPTLDEMIADPIAFRHYVNTLADIIPRPPPDLHGEAVRNWEYRHLRTSPSLHPPRQPQPPHTSNEMLANYHSTPVTATLRHLRAVFSNHASPRQQAWQYYQTWLTVNNTDYRDSPFMAFSSAQTLFEHEAIGRRKCARVAAGMPEKPEKKEKKEKKDK